MSLKRFATATISVSSEYFDPHISIYDSPFPFWDKTIESMIVRVMSEAIENVD